MGPPDRHEAVKQLLEQIPSMQGEPMEAAQRELRVAQVLLGATPTQHNIEYLLEDPARLQLCATWLGEDAPYMKLRVFSSAATRFQDMDMQSFMGASSMLVNGNVRPSLVKHAAAKGLIEDWGRIAAACGGHPALEGSVDAIVEELVSRKFGLSLAEDDRPILNLDGGDAGLVAAIKEVTKIIGPAGRKFGDTNGSVVRSLFAFVHARAEEAKERALAGKEAKEEVALQGKEADEEGAEERPDGAKGPAPSRAGAVVDGGGANWRPAVGDEVLTHSGRCKESYDNIRARVVKVLSRQCDVEFMEGPAGPPRAETKRFMIDRVSPPLAVVQPPAAVPPTAEAHTDGLKDHEDKTHQAQLLFGDLTGM